MSHANNRNSTGYNQTTKLTNLTTDKVGRHGIRGHRAHEFDTAGLEKPKIYRDVEQYPLISQGETTP